MHILCLPSHTTHLLQPLDVGVFKSFKSHYNNECRKYMMAHPGRTITPENIAALVGAAWSHSMTPVAGFRKAGAYPLNPGVIDDRQVAPSLAVRPSTKSPSLSSCSHHSGSSLSSSKSVSSTAPFSPEEEKHVTKKAMTYLIHGMKNGLPSTILRKLNPVFLWSPTFLTILHQVL